MFLCSCGEWQEKSDVPPSIGESEMIKIMVDLAISDAMVEVEMLETNKLIYQKKLSFYASIFEKHGFTENEFISSYEIYSEDLTHLSAMCDSVLTIISTKEINLNAIENE